MTSEYTQRARETPWAHEQPQQPIPRFTDNQSNGFIRSQPPFYWETIELCRCLYKHEAPPKYTRNIDEKKTEREFTPSFRFGSRPKFLRTPKNVKWAISKCCTCYIGESLSTNRNLLHKQWGKSFVGRSVGGGGERESSNNILYIYTICEIRCGAVQSGIWRTIYRLGKRWAPQLSISLALSLYVEIGEEHSSSTHRGEPNREGHPFCQNSHSEKIYIHAHKIHILTGIVVADKNGLPRIHIETRKRKTRQTVLSCIFHSGDFDKNLDSIKRKENIKAKPPWCPPSAIHCAIYMWPACLPSLLHLLLSILLPIPCAHTTHRPREPGKNILLPIYNTRIKYTRTIWNTTTLASTVHRRTTPRPSAVCAVCCVVYTYASSITFPFTVRSFSLCTEPPTKAI